MEEETDQNQEQNKEQEPQVSEETKEETKPEETKKEEKDLTAVLSYIGILFLVPLLVCKDNSFAQFHAKQGLVLCIAEIATSMISWIPVVGWIALLCWIIWFVLSVIGIVNVLNGKKEGLPVIGKFADSFKI